MSVKTILNLAGNKMGLNPSDAGQRSVMLRYLNEAAYELYMQADMSGSLVEQVFKVNGDQTVALPSYVGAVRAVREYTSMIPWAINQLKPRYNHSNWNDFWRNFRLKGKRALMSAVTNQSVVTVSVVGVEASPLKVTITGQTPYATSISEVITMDSETKQSLNTFLDITAVTKDRVTNYDVTLTDVDGKILTVIPNNELVASYQIIDVSSAPWLNNSGGKLDHYLEILYKQALPWFENDGDEFPAQDYDHIIANKMMQIWCQEQGKADEANYYDQLTTRSLARRHEEENRSTEDVIALVENPHDNLQPKIRARRPARYGGYSTTTRYGIM